jgi:spoIIIJ-associated protein
MSAEYSGRSLEEAVARALAALGATRERVDIEVVQEPKAALLGLGGREARVRATLKPTLAQFAQAQAEQILRLMGFDGTAMVQESAETVSITLAGHDLGALIGRHGHTLDAMELLLGLHLARRRGHWIPTIVDAQGYRARREQTLVEAARVAADRAAREGQPVVMEPMEARDRRTIHLALQDDPRVTTASEGEEEQRRVVVRPKEPAAADE